ncbi:PH domain-containing protein [Marinobacter bryozoorum]|uniref:PH domain-containing protein n=1 Tax=Marinobacter bryozoorum TaxID=256324 RepID=UPI0020057483|nr:PH domain-containing protein [Marinobacter bryozoorum]MCK7543720.1 PH domain-containing protein [Marinobacter bryozoorum]
MSIEIIGYAARNLEPGEKIVFQTRTHWITLASPVIFILVGVAVTSGVYSLGVPDMDTVKADPVSVVFDTPHTLLLVVALFFLLQGVLTFIRRLMIVLGSEMTITSRRVIDKAGVIWRDADEIHAGKLEGSKLIRQSWLGQLLNYGTLAINGTGGKVITLLNARQPMTVRRNISRLIAYHEKRQRRLDNNGV